MKIFLLTLILLVNSFIYGQCACVWVDLNGDVQCELYSNCSGPNLTECGTKTTGGSVCPCQVYSGMNWNCGACQPNGSCWYNGKSCDADLVCGYITLPINLKSFEVDNINGVNTLKWVTASETNNDYFLLEHSTDGQKFQLISKIPGAGNSNQNRSYYVHHMDPEEVVNYYKLTQIDFDGVGRESFIISINNEKLIKKEIKRINMLGQDIDENYRGLIIIMYEDGTFIKINQ
jgi:hypothetical protein